MRLVAGDLVPADDRLIEARNLFVNQALLTGEPYPVEKRAADLPRAVDPGGATNTLFMGTPVISGTWRAVVLRTGGATLLGGMAHSLTTPPPPTDFEIGVRHFGLLILRVTVFLVLFVLLANVLFHRPWLDSLMFAVALAVGLTLELLPMVVTVTLARGALRLAERKVIVKRLTAEAARPRRRLSRRRHQRRGGAGPALPADPGAAEQPALRRLGDRHSLRPCRSETITRPVRWNMALIHRFMLVLGPVSSLFDFLTFYVLLTMFGAGEALFQTGWFVDSLATQVLIILIIRTRRSPLDSRPHPLLATLSVGMVLLGAALPLSPLGPLFGFVPLPPAYFAFFAVAVIAYLFLAEGIKRLFFRRFGRPNPMRKGA